ncbi:HipA family kinase [Streptomyces glaucus]|uniref:HipA-like kinase domain-containing protein n=1 Tax=Streptomyces glaucus TaxID=284029 RepID=A0ABN3JYP5_9ACTN
MLREVGATRYVEPLHSGGSVPGVVEADDLGTYVVKFTGSAQGRKALVAEVIVGELARALGLRFPELVLVHFDPAIAGHEPHQEVRDLHTASAGVNLGMDYLPGARDFTPELAEAFPVDPLEAGRIVWLDALTANVDRTVHSSNLMVWPTLGVAPPRLWLIDHGAALVFHHRWDTSAPDKAYDFRHHALGSYGPDVRAADAELAPKVTEELLRRVTAAVPDAWLSGEPGFGTPRELREAYVDYLYARVRASAAWLPTDFPTREDLAAEEARRAERTRRGRPDWLKRVPDLHGKPTAEQDWSVHLG